MAGVIGNELHVVRDHHHRGAFGVELGEDVEELGRALTIVDSRAAFMSGFVAFVVKL